ncbi:MAG: ABC transporter permease subunit [Gammaproteobacteria bacterium]|nr:ABC transporter permease subunit [Gammaproteobacteria bacterium]
MLLIAGRELRSMFASPLAWTVLAVVQVILAYVFLIRIEAFVQLQPRLPLVPNAPGLTALVVAPLFQTAGGVLMTVAPLLTMRLISEELRSGTFTLLMSSPLTITQIVVGKFLAVVAFFCVAIAVIALMPLLLLLGGDLDLGLFAACLLSLFLLLASFSAAGLYMSSLTSQPAVAAVSTFGLLLLLWLLDWAGAGGGSGTSALFSYLSISSHSNALLRGEFDTRDLAYFALFVLSFLSLAIRRLDWLRIQD